MDYANFQFKSHEQVVKIIKKSHKNALLLGKKKYKNQKSMLSYAEESEGKNLSMIEIA